MSELQKHIKASRTRLTREIYGLIIEGFRRHPGDHNAAAKVANVDPRTAKKAWDVGLGYDWARVPIRELIANEQILTRAAVQRQEAAAAGGPVPPVPTEQDRDLAARDVAKSRAQEGTMVRLARTNVVALLSISANLLKGMSELSKRVRSHIEDPNSKIELPVAMRTFSSMAAVIRSAARAGESVIEMERQLFGGDDAGASDGPMTTEDAIKDIREASAALERAKKAGFVVHEGGKAE